MSAPAGSPSSRPASKTGSNWIMWFAGALDKPLHLSVSGRDPGRRQLRTGRRGHPRAVPGRPRRQVRRRFPWDARGCAEKPVRAREGEMGFWGRVAPPREHRERMESVARRQLARLASWRRKKHLASANSQSCPEMGWAWVWKRHCASPAGMGVSFPEENSSPTAAPECSFITSVIPRPAHPSTFCALPARQPHTAQRHSAYFFL